MLDEQALSNLFLKQTPEIENVIQGMELLNYPSRPRTSCLTSKWEILINVFESNTYRKHPFSNFDLKRKYG